MNDTHLRWLQYNRRGPNRGQAQPDARVARLLATATPPSAHGELSRASELAPAALQAAVARSALQARVRAVLADYGGQELCQAVELLAADRGVVTLGVREPGMLYHLRLQWEQRLLDLVRGHVPELGVRAVRFVARWVP